MRKDKLALLINEFLTGYEDYRDGYVLSRGGALVMHGVREFATGVDLVVDEKFWQRLLQEYQPTDRNKNNELHIATRYKCKVFQFVYKPEYFHNDNKIINGIVVSPLNVLLAEKLTQTTITSTYLADLTRLKALIQSEKGVQ